MASSEANTGHETAQSLPAESTTIDLRVLSPSPGIPQEGLSFPNTPASITAGDLKRMIQNAVESAPEPARQRLIYRGRVVARDTDILSDVFGRDQVCAIF
jgi:hypothetical protein